MPCSVKLYTAIYLASVVPIIAFHVSCMSVMLSQLIRHTRITKPCENMLRVLAGMLSSSARCYSHPAGVPSTALKVMITLE